MKKRLIAFVLVAILLSSYISVNASVINNEGVITVSGQLKELNNNVQVMVYVVKINDKSNPPQISDFIACNDKENFFSHIGIADVNENGTYTHTFNFTKPSGDYRVFTVLNDEVLPEDDIEFLSYEEIVRALSAINGKKGMDLAKYLIENKVKLSLDLSLFTTDIGMLVLADNVEKGIPYSHQKDLSDNVDKAILEINLLNEISNTDLWVQVNPILRNQSVVSIDFTRYDKLKNDEARQKVDALFVGKNFLSAKELKNAFDKAVSEAYSKERDNSTPGGGSPYVGKSPGNSGGGVPVNIAENNYYNKNEDENGNEKENELKFTDLASVPWARDAISYLYYKNYISGKSEKEFAPDDLITREEFVKIITLCYRLENESADLSFDDLPDSHWSARYISSAVASGIIKGIDKKRFGLGLPITRQDLCVILYRAANMDEKVLPVFKDSDEISNYAKEAVGTLAYKKVINGFEDGTFKPTDNATRAEAAIMIYNLLRIED